MKEYQINVIAGTKVMHKMVERVESYIIEAAINVPTVIGGANEDSAVVLVPGPAGKDRKMTKVLGWFKNATGAAWEAPKYCDNTNWWNGSTWLLGSSVPYPTADGKVDKVHGKSLVSDTEIEKLTALPTNTALNTVLSRKVDKVEGKGLSTNDFSNEHKDKVDILKKEGADNKFLNEKGFYEKVTAPIQSIAVNGADVAPDENGKVSVEIPDAPVQAISLNGVDIAPDENGIVDIEIPDVKAPVQSISVNGFVVEPDSAGNVDINVVQEVEQTVNPNSTNAVSSAAVAAEFAGLGAKYGSALSLNTNGEDEDKTYSISLLDEEGNILSTTDEFSGGGGGGEVSTTKIVLTKQTENPTVKEGDQVMLNYYFDHRDTASDSSTGLQGEATITIISGATSKEIKQRLNADSNNQIDVSALLLVGNNTVRIRVEVDNGGSLQVSTISWRVQVVTLRLSSTFNFAQLYTVGQSISLPYNLNGSGTKALKLYVDGVQSDEKTITTSSSSGSFTVSTAGLSHGSHSLQLVAELAVTASNILKSNSIYFDVAIANNGSAPIVATRFEHNDGSIIPAGARPYVDVKQFQEYSVRYAGYDPLSNLATITVKVYGETLAATNSAFSQLTTSDKKTQNGTFPGAITIGATVYTFNVAVSQSNIDISEPTDGVQLKLSALGRSNSDANRAEWDYQNIKTTFSGVQWEGDGWTGTTLMLRNSGQAVIGYKPLNNADATNSFTFQCKYKVSDVSDNNTAVVSCMSGGVGFQITAEEARMVTAGNSEVVMKFAAGRAYNVAFVSHPASQSGSSEYEILNSQMLYLYIDGIMSGGIQRGSTDAIYQSDPANITLKGTDSTLEVYGMRAYNTYLTDSQVLDLFILDIDNVDDLIAKYELNSILDSEGNVTVDSLPDDARYVIITGQQANGMSTVKYAEAINNKSTKYDVDEILSIVKNKPELNFKCIGGCISLQGTSSLAYPIKNNRIYFRSAGSSSVFGQVYTGVDAQGNGGTLITAPKPKVSFRSANAQGKIPAPVNVWCLKADYAESSSSHNTGLAVMTNQILQESGDKTPAQKYVDPNHPYDVRTTIDGEPCYLFYRNSLVDAPRLVGKFNMNNDKSTEEVFGFLNIPGYHDQAWVSEKFGGENPTQCWEFLNNDYPMGMYLDDDFDTVGEDGSPKWTKVFESRFPDNQDIYNDGSVKPQNLQRWVKWVKSTQNSPAKFKAELSQYADIRHLCSYFVFTQLLGAVDQMVKNSMLGFWYDPEDDKVKAYYIFYDGDTINGVRNDGRLKYPWDISRQTLDPELTASAGINKYAFAGHDSVLWNNLESQFATEIGEAYTRLRARMTNDYILQVFGKNQSEKFSERIFNIDAQYKYVAPKTIGTNVIVGGQVQNTKYSYLEAMQGSRKSHREWWLTNRLELFDGRYSTGQYPLTDISWKGVSDAGAKVTAESSREFYFEFKREGQSIYKSATVSNTPWSYTYNQAANVGTIFHLYGGKFMSKLNLATWGGFTDMNLPVLPLLKELILGMTGKTYTLSEIVIGDKLPMVELIDIRNYITIPTLDLFSCKSLRRVIATGCTGMFSIQLPSGAPLVLLSLPKNLKTLTLKGLPVLTQQGITFDGTNSVDNLIVENCPLIDWETLYTTLGTVKNIRVTGIDKSGDGTWLNQFKNLGGIDSNGNVVSTPRLVGTYQLTRYYDDITEYPQLQMQFPDLNIKQPEYSVYEYDWQVLDSNPISNPDNRTGARFGNTYVASGHIKNILNGIYRCLGKQEVENEMSVFPLHNENSNYFATSKQVEGSFPAVLDGSQGDVFVYVPKYWYKGISDYETRKHYALYASTKPSQPDLKVIKRSDITFNINGRALLTSYSTLEASFQVNDDFRVIRIDVEGYNLVEFPTINMFNTLYCNIFTNVDDVIISKVGPNKGYDFVNGASKYICPVPQGAKYLYITCLTSFTDYTFTGINLTKSNNIFDLATWVETAEVLHGAFTTSIDDNKLKSISSSTVSTSQVPYSTSLVMANSRNMDILRYEEYKNLQNLLVFNYGSLIPEVKLGSAGSGIPGTTALMGVTDTYARNGVTTRPIGQQNPETYPSITSTNFKGLEDIFTLMYSIRGILMSYIPGTISPVNIWLSKSGDKKILFSALPYSSNPTGITFGKVLWQQGMYHVPILSSPAGQLYNTNWARSSSTFGYEFAQFIHFAKNSNPLNLDVVGRVRLMFDGKVSRVSNLSEFLNKRNNF